MGFGEVLLEPTYDGYVKWKEDALLLIEACLSGYLIHSPRRPHSCETNSPIKSRFVFIYEMNSSEINAWIDGIDWISVDYEGDFLISCVSTTLSRVGLGLRQLLSERCKRSDI